MDPFRNGPDEPVIIQMPPEPRAAKVHDSTATIGEGPIRLFGKEGPDVEVLDPAPWADEVLGGTLAKAKEQKAIPIQRASLRAAGEQSLEVCQREISEPAQIFRSEQFE